MSSIEQPKPPFGKLLKFWRQLRNFSQEELAFRIDSASRHISRLEKGQAHPGLEMVENIATAMDMRERDRHLLLLSAGYSPHSANADILSDEFSVRRKEIIRSLRSLDPNPSFLTDVTGKLIMVNRAWLGFQKNLISNKPIDSVTNFFEFLFEYAGQELLPQNFENTLSVFLLSLRQAAIFSNNEATQGLFERLVRSPATPDDWQTRAANRESGQDFHINALINGRGEKFFSHSHNINLRGPLDYVSQPELILVTFYSEDETLDLSSLLSHENKHPLLLY